MRNNKGFTLIESLITLAIMGFSSMVLMSIIMTSLKGQVNVNSLSDWTNLQDRIKLFISNPNLCPQVVSNMNTNQISLAGENLIQGARLSSGNTITSLYVQLLGATPNPNEYTTYLRLSGIKNEFAMGPKLLKEMLIPLTITVNPANNDVTACSMTSVAVNNPQANCTSLGGVWSQNGNSGNWHCTL